ncbi:hypothetical protein GIW46_17640 [Pseudomonas syringae]|uniref:hypothetical protein n=1 Tax=Pseudomonas syringae TaxID=317 RepID=UPI002FDA9852|nr:hypothetical protein [Pseudomonas syringae]
MKISYFGYSLQHKVSQEAHLIDLSKTILSFADLSSPEFKGSFRFNSEYVYLKRVSGDVCMLLMTRDGERFRSINTANLSISEIRSMLGSEEKIGFASYVVIKPYYFGFASSSLSPKFDAFTELVNELLNRTDNGNFNFRITPLLKQATKSEAVSMEYIGRTTIEVGQKNTLTNHLLNFLSVGDCVEELDSIEITIKPKRNRNIKPIIEALIENTSDDELKKLHLKAKNDATSAMLELYVAGRGVISDSLDFIDESLIAASIEEKIVKNTTLQEQLVEHLRNGQKDKADFSRILRYCDEHSWTAFVDSVQNDYKLRQ